MPGGSVLVALSHRMRCPNMTTARRDEKTPTRERIAFATEEDCVIRP
ncbi:hypothetical protein [Rhizobium leguminosarum]|nr:hypothetical protein [Rhizobium leguminosarum]MBY5657202.1 hypothetical protein [Rhizobium leguminosarum]